LSPCNDAPFTFDWQADAPAPTAANSRASGRCPPEDVGGPWGYAEALEAIRDPNHERHAELTEWIPDDFDPAVVDTERLEANLDDLAKRWARKPAAKRPRRA
jgi:Plasmid pRiA4b ORF-3-like protein